MKESNKPLPLVKTVVFAVFCVCQKSNEEKKKKKEDTDVISQSVKSKLT